MNKENTRSRIGMDANDDVLMAQILADAPKTPAKERRATAAPDAPDAPDEVS